MEGYHRKRDEDEYTSSDMTQPSTATTATKKKKKKKKNTTNPIQSSSSSGHTPTEASATIDTRPASSFHEELEWCIAQLQLGMLRSGATKAQKQHNEKSIRVLQATKTSLPRKRQLMRNLFGDYRSKMIVEPVTVNFEPKEPKLEPAKQEVIETVGTFFKKSSSSDTTREYHKDSNFNFNFSIPK